MLNIVFGSVKTASNKSFEAQYNFPSIKLEMNRGKGTSRRMLFNREASSLLKLEDGESQNLLFGFAGASESTPARLFVVNTEDFRSEVLQKTYKTSKNKSSYNESKEKGKSIGSSALSNEIRQFLSLDDSNDTDFILDLYDDSGESPLYEVIIYDGKGLSVEDSDINEIIEDREAINESPDTEEIVEDKVVQAVEEISSFAI